MLINKIYIFVEGNDDERFFKSVILPYLKDYKVYFIQYAQLKKKILIRYVQTIKDSGYVLIFTADLDELPGVTHKKKAIKNKYELLDGHRVIVINNDDIVIVVKEIESWYLAGLPDEKADEFRIDRINSTDEVTKEIFNNIYHGKFHSRIDFMIELLKHFSIHCAIPKNHSFEYFVSNYLDDSIYSQ